MGLLNSDLKCFLKALVFAYTSSISNFLLLKSFQVFFGKTHASYWHFCFWVLFVSSQTQSFCFLTLLCGYRVAYCKLPQDKKKICLVPISLHSHNIWPFADQSRNSSSWSTSSLDDSFYREKKKSEAIFRILSHRFHTWLNVTVVIL